MESRVKRTFWALALAAIVAVTLTASASTEAPVPHVELRAISARLDGPTSLVAIEASAPVAYVTSRPDPLTVLVDLRNVKAGELPPGALRPVPPVADVKLEEAVAADGAAVARVRVTLSHDVKHRVRSARNVIFVEMDNAATATDAAGSHPTAHHTRGGGPESKGPKDTKAPKITPSAPAYSNTAKTREAAAAALPPARELRAATTLKSVRALTASEGLGIAIVGDGELVATSVEEVKDLPPRVLLDFHGVSSRGVPAVTNINRAEVQRVRVATNSTSPLITRVVVDLARKLGFRVENAGANREELRLLFEDASAADAPAAQPEAAAATSPVPAEPAAASTPVLSEPAVVPTVTAEPAAAPAAPPANAMAQAAGVVQPQQPAPASSAASPTSPALNSLVQAQPAPPGQTPGRFSGHPITIDFQGADLRSVLRTFAEISGLNIVIDPSIQGLVDVSLVDVPWDQALDIILRANKLGYAVDGTVVRIAPLTVLASEQEEQRKLMEAQALAGDLQVVTLPLSYARAPELVAILTRSALSARGEVQVDPRTNTLIVRDLPDRLGTAAELVRTLDRPQPQVEIEARIVQSNRDFARAIGVEWGYSGRVDPTLGNTTGLAFPNRGSVTGRTGGVQGPVQGDTSVEQGVNLGPPFTGGPATSAIGIALGSINGALNLDVVLSALERSGRGRLLSTPRVSTQNNVEAEMTQGVEIPIQTVANNTVTVSFKPAALTLRVTPQITASNTVIMRVFLENASPDFSRSVNGIPPIDTQRASTTVLVGDGETTVIGGIYLSREQATEGRVPVLHRIPLLGWLFKKDDRTEESRELLIFITPRITKS